MTNIALAEMSTALGGDGATTIGANGVPVWEPGDLVYVQSSLTITTGQRVPQPKALMVTGTYQIAFDDSGTTKWRSGVGATTPATSASLGGVTTPHFVNLTIAPGSRATATDIPPIVHQSEVIDQAAMETYLAAQIPNLTPPS